MLQCDTPAVACAAGPANKSCYCAQHNLHVGQAHTSAFARYLRASFADDVQFSPSLDDFAGVTQSLDGRAHAHRVTDVLELSRAFSSLRQSTTQRRYGRVSAKPIELSGKLSERTRNQVAAGDESLCCTVRSAVHILLRRILIACSLAQVPAESPRARPVRWSLVVWLWPDTDKVISHRPSLTGMSRRW